MQRGEGQPEPAAAGITPEATDDDVTRVRHPFACERGIHATAPRASRDTGMPPKYHVSYNLRRVPCRLAGWIGERPARAPIVRLRWKGCSSIQLLQALAFIRVALAKFSQQFATALDDRRIHPDSECTIDIPDEHRNSQIGLVGQFVACTRPLNDIHPAP